MALVKFERGTRILRVIHRVPLRLTAPVLMLIVLLFDSRARLFQYTLEPPQKTPTLISTIRIERQLFLKL